MRIVVCGATEKRPWEEEVDVNGRAAGIRVRCHQKLICELQRDGPPRVEADTLPPRLCPASK